MTVYEQSGPGSRCVDRIEASHSLRLSIEIGRVTPIYAGASAKALLAFLEEPIVAEVLSQPLERLAPGTVTDADALRAQLAEIRRRGWAESYEENNVGAWGVAAPIIVDERLVASVGIAAPIARHSDAAVRSLVKLVKAAARQSADLLHPAAVTEGEWDAAGHRAPRSG